MKYPYDNTNFQKNTGENTLETAQRAAQVIQMTLNNKHQQSRGRGHKM